MCLEFTSIEALITFNTSLTDVNVYLENILLTLSFFVLVKSSIQTSNLAWFRQNFVWNPKFYWTFYLSSILLVVLFRNWFLSNHAWFLLHSFHKRFVGWIIEWRKLFIVLQWKPLNVITLGQGESDNIIRMITISDSSACIKYLTESHLGLGKYGSVWSH